jgi:hypothetical protein
MSKREWKGTEPRQLESKPSFQRKGKTWTQGQKYGEHIYTGKSYTVGTERFFIFLNTTTGYEVALMTKELPQ